MGLGTALKIAVKAKHRTVATLLEQGIDPVGVHVMADEIIRGTGKFRHLIGTVKRVYKPEPFSERVEVRFFNGEKWPTDYPPYRLEIIER